MRDYYKILEVPEGASLDEIKQSYRRLAKQYHPDVNKSQDAHQKFCEISEAYEFLTNHWPRYSSKYASSQGYEQKYREHQNSDVYEQFIREAQERARKQARMRYEKFRRQHEAFQESGLNDIALLITIVMRAFSLILFLFLFLTPLILTAFDHWSWILTIFFVWPFAAGLAWYFHDNRKNYFKPGNFYYSAAKIKQLFTEKHQTSERCYYCKNKKADSRPYKLELLKLKDVRFGSQGFRQHNVKYVNKDLTVMIPRSQKAFIIQSINNVVKILSIIACLFFLNISSTPWRLIFGMVTGGIISGIVLVVSGTRSNVSYLITYNQIIRIVIWIAAVAAATKFYFKPFDAVSKDTIYFVIFALVIFDSFLLQLLSIALGKYAFYPLIHQHPQVEAKIKEGYILYNDIPVLSFFYPIFKWILG
ncbi:MAG TPA: DnaJ domain-containing protein [Bacteroidales bacterium]|jgi:hypothetical protein|nr:DnaJ domain-containing protein [Bacteroidales bacterium]